MREGFSEGALLGDENNRFVTEEAIKEGTVNWWDGDNGSMGFCG
jgi:hypothetical protein